VSASTANLPSPKHALFRRSVQTFAFVRKEAVDVVHQPRLLLTLVLGPFLILLAFGLGYDQQTKPYRTLFVIPADSPLRADIEKDAQQFGSYVRFEGVTSDEAGARDRLRHGQLDVVVVFPADPLADVLAGRQATVTLVHNRLDPVELTGIDFASRLAVDQINSQVLSTLVGQGQQLARPLRDVVTAASQAASTIDSSLQTIDNSVIRSALAALDDSVDQLDLAVRSAAQLADRFGGPGSQALADRAAQLQTTIDSLRGDVASLRAAIDTTAIDQARQQLASTTNALQTLNRDFDQLTSVESSVLVQPFVAQVQSTNAHAGTVTDFYAPAALVLLLQQFGVAFGALSFVRERNQGIDELFRAAPVGATQAVVGKYLSYLILGSLVGAALTGLLIGVLHVPFASSVWTLGLALALTLVASIGLGLVISLLSPSDTLAVQLTMLVLLASLFFSGFFLPVEQLVPAAQVISWALPATYGIRLARDNMLRGISGSPAVVAGLAAYAAAALAITLVGARRRMSVVR
jgi:ABC-2 type transport system permease protein